MLPDTEPRKDQTRAFGEDFYDRLREYRKDQPRVFETHDRVFGEDFYDQLREYQRRQDAAREEALNASDLSFARSMLASIGVECKK